MEKLRVLGVALAALFAFAALTAASASAVTFLLAEWLKAGVGLTATELSDTEAGPEGVLLEETVLFVKIDILCSGIFDGSLGRNGADEITELLTLPTSTLVSSTPLVEPALVCTNVENCPEPLVWLDDLPWLSLAELMVDGAEEFWVDLVLEETILKPGSPGIHLACMNGTSELCTWEELITKLTNDAVNGVVDGVFEEAFTELAGLKLGNCENSTEKLIIEGLGTLLLTGGGSLSVSSGP